ncbi:ABC transporter substrate-binding protein [Paraburkholderia sp. LEh10]|uniref:ABC transporter substrate-binding protein n=1 Tax=Paraburkholderia sp. LEh10 TaxID=2821353 RepID=UPI001AE715A4|nr:ABC transporter substrate-binding protein [Paraburkholderia sp. LEh10]MBP0596290.1 ABC transporter substrate-binding protein [Paraburkholderia sp. LEh10]
MKGLFIAFALAVAASGAHAKDWKEIRFGTDPSYAPFESKAVDGKLVGFDIDLGNAICAKLQAKCVWVQNDFDGMIPALQAKKFDGVLAAMGVTEARQKQIAFSDKIYNLPTRLIAKKNSGLQPTAASLKGKHVGVEQGSTAEAYAKVHWESAGVVVTSYQNQDLVYQDLLSGRLDASLQDAVQAELGFLGQPKGHDFAFAGAPVDDPKILGTGSAIGLRKEDVDLKQAINKALAEIIQDGTYKSLEKKYFTFDIY